MNDYMTEGLEKYIEVTELKTFEKNMKCTKEGCTGKIVYTGGMLTSNPPWFGHRCTICGLDLNLRERFPRLIYQSIEGSDGGK